MSLLLLLLFSVWLNIYFRSDWIYTSHNGNMKWINNFRKEKQTPWPLVRERTLPTERSPLVDQRETYRKWRLRTWSMYERIALVCKYGMGCLVLTVRNILVPWQVTAAQCGPTRSYSVAADLLAGGHENTLNCSLGMTCIRWALWSIKRAWRETNVLEGAAEKSDKIFSTSSTIICLCVGSQMPTSVSYLSNKQTHLNICAHIITCISWIPRVSLRWYWNIYFVLKWFYLFLPFHIVFGILLEIWILQIQRCTIYAWCNIRGFHDSDYEECRLLAYNNPVRTSQETPYVSAR
jgi:hypothetical protein